MTRSHVYRFSSKTLAESFVGNAVKPLWIVMGDDSKYWVVTPADAARLERAGYVMA